MMGIQIYIIYIYIALLYVPYHMICDCTCFVNRLRIVTYIIYSRHG